MIYLGDQNSVLFNQNSLLWVFDLLFHCILSANKSCHVAQRLKDFKKSHKSVTSWEALSGQSSDPSTRLETCQGIQYFKHKTIQTAISMLVNIASFIMLQLCPEAVNFVKSPLSLQTEFYCLAKLYYNFSLLFQLFNLRDLEYNYSSLSWH